MKPTYLTLLLALIGGACQRADVASNAPLQSEPTKTASNGTSGRHTLGIRGFNYTDRVISSFSVDGAGGDILDVSSPTEAGGGTVCCIGWRDGKRLPVTMNVLWSTHKCLRKGTNRFGETFDFLERSQNEREVAFNGPVPADPSYLEVHFYPDGRVEIEMTADRTEPRLKLDPGRRYRPGPCKEDNKP